MKPCQHRSLPFSTFLTFRFRPYMHKKGKRKRQWGHLDNTKSVIGSWKGPSGKHPFTFAWRKLLFAPEARKICGEKRFCCTFMCDKGLQRYSGSRAPCCGAPRAHNKLLLWLGSMGSQEKSCAIFQVGLLHEY